MLSVSDSGKPSLTRYARVVVAVRDHAVESGVLARYCSPPPEFANAYGSYRSPLQLPDGSSVRTAADWARRRQQLLTEWHKLMGPWPPLLENPAMDYLSQTRREHFTEDRVKVQIAPDQTSEGWLLVPDGKGPFPAVLVVYYEPETSVGLGKERLRDFGLQLAQRGFVTLSIGTPGGNAWKPALGEALRLGVPLPIEHDPHPFEALAGQAAGAGRPGHLPVSRGGYPEAHRSLSPLPGADCPGCGTGNHQLRREV